MAPRGRGGEPVGRGHRHCWMRRRSATWRAAGSWRWRLWCAMRRSPGPAAARPRICPWLRCRRPRSSGWSAPMHTSARIHIEDILPLSPLQEGLLFHALFDAQGPDFYTMQLAFVIEGPLESDALRAAADALVQRHASLRAAFRHENLSRPVQIILPAVRVPWRSIDLSVLDEAAREEHWERLLLEDRAER